MDYFTIYEDIFKFFKVIFLAVVFVLICTLCERAWHGRHSFNEKELASKGLGYYTNDVNGKTVFKLKEIK